MKNKSLSFKLNISILILLLLILIGAVYTIIMINKTQTFAQETGQEWLPSVLSVSQMNEGIGKYARRIIGLLTTSLINTGEEEIKTKEEDIKTLDKYAKIIDEYLANHQKFADSEKEKSLLNDIVEKWKMYDASSREAIEINKKGEKAEAIRSILSKGRKAASDLEAAVKNLGDYNYKGGVDSTAKGANLTAITNITMATIIGTSILIALFIFKIIATTTVALTHAIENLKHQSEASNDIANKLKDGSDILSHSVSEQASSVHETTAAINEISSMVNRTAENARE
ncbi:MAG: methyl-accepting chemotaxis protein [Spirobacillus cienkowskii]|jgi:methyl-accepting chemotaxis protein|uniref:Methyl-accepting chemotaxis protein n=1 Tax=Spirobacillus cienkowskii TaxID=495820 RepID=A0A369KNZ2_9BACT|nr:MAG: methyl-accepting chemotaxis protein [Spirobacillus cienkowskii]